MVTLLTNHGMTDIDAVQLDRKFRNLKKTYFCIRNKHLERGSQYQPNWQFYDQMAEILKDEAPPGTQVVLSYDDYDHSNPMASFLVDDYDEADSEISILGGNQETVVTPADVNRNPNRKRNTMDGSGTAGRQQPKIRRNNNMRGEPPQTDRVVVYNAAEPEVSIVETKEELSIGTTEQALRHLRAIQEFAMIQDNFRAIGLLMQAEHAIQYPPKAKDFEIDQS
ncbi:hypothetical protein KR054_012152 [Drosophila jambulina]|nr:hypothetical protein KR054_012152 [Drosophila jambulina]